MPLTPPYPEPFRREAVALVRSSETSMPQPAAELGVSPQSLRNWIKRSELDCGERRDRGGIIAPTTPGRATQRTRKETYAERSSG
jgi:transposase-like protein